MEIYRIPPQIWEELSIANATYYIAKAAYRRTLIPWRAVEQVCALTTAKRKVAVMLALVHRCAVINARWNQGQCTPVHVDILHGLYYFGRRERSYAE